MNELVQRLSEGEYAVEASLRPEKTATALKEVSTEELYISNSQTINGVTDLGIRLNPEASNFNEACFCNFKFL